MRGRARAMPYYKQGWFLGLSAALALVGSALALVTGIGGLVKSEPPKKYSQNTEIVLDRSAGMKEPFGGLPSKMAAAAKAVELLLQDDVLESTNLAFRTFGASC